LAIEEDVLLLDDKGDLRSIEVLPTLAEKRDLQAEAIEGPAVYFV
jgi:hypothetical protein